MSWGLPKSAVLSGEEYPHRWDFREILKLLSLLGDESKPETLRWYAACFYFYQDRMPPAEEAFSYLEHFLTAGEQAAPGPKLFRVADRFSAFCMVKPPLDECGMLSVECGVAVQILADLSDWIQCRAKGLSRVSQLLTPHS